jgi:hypothetical protein
LHTAHQFSASYGNGFVLGILQVGGIGSTQGACSELVAYDGSTWDGQQLFVAINKVLIALATYANQCYQQGIY